MTLTATVLGVQQIQELESMWRELADCGDNVFASYVIACEEEDGRLSALVPLYEAARRPIPVLRLVGHGASDQLGAVGAAAVAEGALSAARRVLYSDARWGLTILEDLPAEYACPGNSLGVRSSPVVSLQDGDWSAWLASKSRNFRHQAGKLERRLARRGQLRFRVADDLLAFRTLHEAKWGARSRAFTGRWEFHERFADAARERGWLRIHLLYLNERPVAALYNLRFGGVETCYQAGRLPDLAGAGFILHVHAIRAAMQDGLREYRFLRGEEPYKFRFADTDRGVQTVAFARGLPGNAMLRVLLSATVLPPALRWKLPSVLRWGLAGAPVQRERVTE